jgi:hypothetical protein
MAEDATLTRRQHILQTVPGVQALSYQQTESHTVEVLGKRDEAMYLLIANGQEEVAVRFRGGQATELAVHLARHRRLFPVLHQRHPGRGKLPDLKAIPWGMIEPHRAQAARNHGDQTLERLAERGGLDPAELVAVLTDQKFKNYEPAEAADPVLEAMLTTYLLRCYREGREP